MRGGSSSRPEGAILSTKTDIPVTVTPEAAAFVAELGLQEEFEQIEATVKDYDAAQGAENAWGVWRLTAFPPQVGLNFILPEPENAG